MYTINFNEQEENRVYDLNSAIEKCSSVYATVCVNINKSMLVQISKREAYKIAQFDDIYAYWNPFDSSKLIIGQ